MKYLFLLLLLAGNAAFSQTGNAQKSTDLKETLKKVRKHKCVLFYNERFASPETKKQAEEANLLLELDFATLDSLFYIEKPEVRLKLFSVMCSKYRSQITEKHLEKMSSEQKVNVCNNDRAEEATIAMVSNYLYQNSVERKEKIISEEAFTLFREATELLYIGPVDFERVIALLNRADSLEPENPIILSERGEVRLNSKLDTDGAFTDFRDAIRFSLDENVLEARYYNLGLSYMGLCDIETACDCWKKAGSDAASYFNEHCTGQIDTVIHKNPDDALLLSLKLENPVVKIVSAYNSPGMSSCNATLTIRNLSHGPVTFIGNNVDYGLESDETALYLEAVDEKDRKFRFFTETEYYSYNDKEDRRLMKGEDYTTDLDLTFVHQFPYEGKYKVRVALRPSKNSSGLEQTYYSDWQELEVVKD